MKKTVVHFEIGCSNIKETTDFYKSVFGWNLKQQGNAATINTGNANSLSGHINKLGSNDPQSYVTIYIETDTLTADLKAVEAKGGKVFVEPVKLPDGREFAWFEDVAGNKIGLITPANNK